MWNEGTSLLWHGRSDLYVTSLMQHRNLYGLMYLGLSFLKHWVFLKFLVVNCTW